MDDTNLQAIQTAADHWSDKHEIPADYMAKVRKGSLTLHSSVPPRSSMRMREHWPQVSKMTQYLRSDKFRLKYDGECTSVPFRDTWIVALDAIVVHRKSEAWLLGVTAVSPRRADETSGWVAGRRRGAGPLF